MRRVRICVLVTLGICAVLLLLLESRELGSGSRGAEQLWTLAGLGVALGSILARRAAAAPRASVPRRVRLTLLAWGLAGVLGVMGVVAAFSLGEARRALFFPVAGLIFCLAAPVPRVVTPGRP